MELSGKIIAKLPPMSGEGKNGPWKKQDFIIEMPGTYPKKVAIAVWNERTDDLNALPEGTEIRARVDIESREFNGKWYTDVKCWKLEKLEAVSPTGQGSSNQNIHNSTPTTQEPAPWENNNTEKAEENPFGNENNQQSEDDLPF
jgi:hypothetical protein